MINLPKKVLVGVELHNQNSTNDLFDRIRQFGIENIDFLLTGYGPLSENPEWHLNVAKLCAEHHIYFAFIYTAQRGAPPDKKSHLNLKLVKQIKTIAGNYYLGDMLGELGGMSSWTEGYYDEFVKDYPEMVKPNFDNIQDGAAAYVNYVKQFVELDREFDVPAVLAVEATALHRYNTQAGVDYIFLEAMCENMEYMTAAARGASNAAGREWWGSHIATEWYCGMDNNDEQKYARMSNAYKFSYLAGASIIYPESGTMEVQDFVPTSDDQSRSVTVVNGFESNICQRYRDIQHELLKYARDDERPGAKPLIKIAFVQGQYDSWNGWGSNVAWNNFDKKEYAYGAAENCWEALRMLYAPEPWSNTFYYGKVNYSGNVPYGLYDILPCEASLAVWQEYDCLIFGGWNTMNADTYRKAVEFVKNGGRLIINLPHFATNLKRGEPYKLFNDGDLTELLGFNVGDNSTVELVSGIKFKNDSAIPGYRYYHSPSGVLDPVCTGIYKLPAKITITTARDLAYVSGKFGGFFDSDRAILLENQLGKGFVTTFATTEYMGDGGMNKFYNMVLRAAMQGEQHYALVNVIGSSCLRFAIYPAGVRYKIYLLNTNDAVSIEAAIIKKNQIIKKISINPLQMESIII
jgi:hypothetical protein